MVIYDNSDNLIGISATSKISFNYLHSTTHFGIIKKNDKSFLLFGSGKQRDGYTRALFQRKIFISDSAMIINDTMLYKQTSEKYIRIQYFTGINRDSISFSEVYIPFVKKKDMKASKFSSFNFYKDWFIIDSSASQIVSGMINLRSDTILIRNKIKSNYFINPLNITQESLQNLPGMPITFFWLKDSGLLN